MKEIRGHADARIFHFDYGRLGIFLDADAYLAAVSGRFRRVLNEVSYYTFEAFAVSNRPDLGLIHLDRRRRLLGRFTGNGVAHDLCDVERDRLFDRSRIGAQLR